MPDNSDKIKQAETVPEKNEREASVIESRQAESAMPEYLEQTRQKELDRKALSLTSLPRDENVSGTFGRPGIFELDDQGEIIVHIARSFDKHHDTAGEFLPKLSGKASNKEEMLDTGTMQALAGTNVFFKTLLEIRKKIEQFMPHGIQKDAAIKQLKIDGAESLKKNIAEVKPRSAQREIESEGGTHQALTPDLLEKLKDSPANKSEGKIASIEKATGLLLDEIRRLHGRENTNKLHIRGDDLGYALGAYLLSPHLASALGEQETRRFGQNMLVFGIAPAFGLTQEAQYQITKHASEVIAEGSGSFLGGSAIGMILEGHPAVASITTAILGAAFFGDQLFTPKNQARNAEVLQLLNKSGKANSSELFDMCNRSRELLGPESYHLTLDFVTGGLGVANGRSVGKTLEIDKRMSAVAEKAKELATQLSKLPEEILSGLLSLCGHNPYRPAMATVQGEIVNFSKPAKSVTLSINEMTEPLKMNGRGGSSASGASRTESISSLIKELDPARHTELTAKFEDLSKIPQFEERSALIQELLREKRFDSGALIDLDVVFSPIKPEYLKAYKTAVTNLPQLENLFPDYEANAISQLSRQVQRELIAFSNAIKYGYSAEGPMTAIERINRSIEFAGEKNEIIFRPGVHEYTLAKLERDFATNKERIKLFNGLKSLAQELKRAGCETLYVDGSFITRKLEPGDFDACWEPFVQMNTGTNILLTQDSLSARIWRKQNYLGDIFPRFDDYGDRVKHWQTDTRNEKVKGIIYIDLRRL